MRETGGQGEGQDQAPGRAGLEHVLQREEDRIQQETRGDGGGFERDGVAEGGVDGGRSSAVDEVRRGGPRRGDRIRAGLF